MTQEPIQSNVEDIITHTPYGDTKTSEVDIQFSADPSYGLTAERYGWFSNDTMFDSSFFNEGDGQIEITTGSASGDSARIRSAYPGRYFSHTVAEPGLGLEIPEAHLEYDSNNRVSLTHGEISAEIVEWDDSTDSGVNAHGISFEPDGAYAQVRKGDSNVEFVRQENWNIDTMDGTGPSGRVLRPEKGYIYNFPFTWYGHGSLYLAVQDRKTSRPILLHRTEIDSGVSLGTPNLPIQLTVENKTTADPLEANLGGMQYATYGSGNLDKGELGRSTEETRHTGSSYIDTNVSQTNDAIDPFAEPGRPLISARRDLTELDSKVALSVNVINFFINSGGDLYIFIFDEFDDANALTNENFGEPISRNNARESRLQTDTSATAYSPGANATLRGMLYVSGDKNIADVITGDSSSRLPIDATTVVTAALPPGANSTYAQPAALEMRESF